MFQDALVDFWCLFKRSPSLISFLNANFFALLKAHMNRVTSVIFSLENEWLLSVGRDKYLQWHDCTTGKRLGGYQTEAWCTSLQYPFTKMCFLVVHAVNPVSKTLWSDALFVTLPPLFELWVNVKSSITSSKFETWVSFVVCMHIVLWVSVVFLCIW